MSDNFSQPKRLTDKEFNLLAGTQSMESMINNKFVLGRGDKDNSDLCQWLLKNCQSPYFLVDDYIANLGKRTILYIVNVEDAVLFKLFWSNGAPEYA